MSSMRNRAMAAVAWPTVCLLSITPFPRAVPAQEAGSPSPELIEAILRHMYRPEGGNVRILNGRVPDDLGPSFYLPPRARVLGSVVTGSTVVVFATSTVPFDSLRPQYARALAPAGWKPWTTTMAYGGFVDNLREQPVVFCRDGAQLHVQRLRPTRESVDLVVLSYRDGLGPCEQEGPGAVRGMISAQPRFPTLYAPEDMNSPARTRCFSRGGGSRGQMRTSTMLPATMSAAELLRHYAAQLESAGWRSAAGRGESATGTWTLADTSGVREVTLEVFERGTAATRCFDVQMGASERAR